MDYITISSFYSRLKFHHYTYEKFSVSIVWLLGYEICHHHSKHGSDLERALMVLLSFFRELLDFAMLAQQWSMCLRLIHKLRP